MKITLLSVCLFLLSALLPAQHSIYASPQFGYNGSGVLTSFDSVSFGPNVRGGFYTVNSNQTAPLVMVVEGLSAASVPWGFGQTQLVSNILNTYAASPLGVGSTWTTPTTIPNDPAIVGLSIFYQMVFFYPNHATTPNDYVGSNGVQVTIQ